jgi:hypothetical protein
MVYGSMSLGTCKISVLKQSMSDHQRKRILALDYVQLQHQLMSFQL